MRLAFRLFLLLVLAAVVYGAFAAWTAWQVRGDLAAAEDAARNLQSALEAGDDASREQALTEFGDSAESAADRTDGFVWRTITVLPIVGDDAEGVQALSSSLDTVANEALPPLLDTVDGLEGISQAGQVDIDRVRALVQPVRQASSAFSDAQAEVEDLDSSGYVDPVKDRFDEYVDRLTDITDGLDAGETAATLLPTFLGGDGPRDYLLVFQNNAEARATGGIPGSWAHVHAENGNLEIVRQGSSTDFVPLDGPVVPLTPAEEAVYNEIFGLFWQDATFTPNWPRASELLKARWEASYPEKLDGVISIDPVAMSYIMRGTGPVTVGTATLQPDTVVEQLLSAPYLQLDAETQDAFFGIVAQAAFDAITGDLTSPVEFVKGLDRAVEERRFLLTSYDPAISDQLDGFGITGELPTDDGTEPRVVVGLADATASKMSYYLRYDTEVTATGCEAGRQTLTGEINLSQTITSEQASKLPEVVTGSGDIGIPLGSQLVVVRLYTPTGGTVSDLTVAGEKVEGVEAIDLDGRGVVTLVAQLDGSEPIPVTWTMTTGEGQTGDGLVQVTPGIEPTSEDSTFESAC